MSLFNGGKKIYLKYNYYTCYCHNHNRFMGLNKISYLFCCILNFCEGISIGDKKIAHDFIILIRQNLYINSNEFK